MKIDWKLWLSALARIVVAIGLIQAVIGLKGSIETLAERLEDLEYTTSLELEGVKAGVLRHCVIDKDKNTDEEVQDYD